MSEQQIERSRTRRLRQLAAGPAALAVIAVAGYISNPEMPIFRDKITDRAAAIKTVAFSADSYTVASGSANRTVRFWSLDDFFSQPPPPPPPQPEPTPSPV